MTVLVELPYSLHTRYTSIAIAWTIILIPPVFLNLGLFYGLWYSSSLDRILVLTLPTGILGVFTLIAILERIYKLTTSAPTYRPLGAGRWTLDIFQCGYFGALILISALISSTLARGDEDDDGHVFQIRLLSLPTSVLMVYLATLTLLSLVLNALSITLLFRFGSLAAGNIVKPALYYIIEDVVAVDGNGAKQYREAWTARYATSKDFRDMLWTLSVVWMLAFYGMAIGFTAFSLKGRREAVYAVGWAGPFPLVGVLAAWTIWFVRRQLTAEREGVARVEGLDGAGDERAPLLENEAR